MSRKNYYAFCIRPITFSLAAVFAFLILSLKPTCSQAEYKIGTVLPLSGPWAFIGQPQKKVLLMLLKEINEHGGVNGRSLQLIIHDTQGKPPIAASAVNRMIRNDKVAAIIGPTLSSTTKSVMPIAAENRTPIITLTQNIEINSSNPSGQWIFQTAPSYSLRIQAALLSMQREDISRFVFCGPAFYTNRLNSLFSNLPSNLKTGMSREIVSYSTDDSSDNIIRLLRQKASEKAVLFFDPFRDQKFISRVRQWGNISPGPRVPNAIYFLDGGLNPRLYRLDLSPRFVYQMNARLILPTFLYPGGLPESQSARRQKIMSFAERYKADTGKRLSVYQFYAHDALKLVEHVLSSVGSGNRKQIRDQIEETRRFIGLVGTYDFSSRNHNGLSSEVFMSKEVQDDGCDEDLDPCETACDTECCEEDGC